MALRNSVKYIEQETGYNIMSFEEIKFIVEVNHKTYVPYEFIKQENGLFQQLPTSSDKPHTGKTGLVSKNIHSRIRYLCGDGLHIDKCEVQHNTTLLGDVFHNLIVHFK